MRSRRPAVEGGGELNLVPYLDVVVNLCMFLLLATSWGGALSQIGIPAMSTCGGGDCAAGGPPVRRVTVAIDPDGYYVLGDAPWAIHIPRDAGGGLDGEALVAHLARVADGEAALPELTLAANDAAQLDGVVATLDAVRDRPDGRELFPVVTLGSLRDVGPK